MNDSTGGGGPGFDLLPEDDALLNYFLSTDVHDEEVSMINSSANASAASAFSSFVSDGRVQAGPGGSIGFDGQLLHQPKTTSQPVSALQQLQAQQQLLVQQDAAHAITPKSALGTDSKSDSATDADEKRERRLARNRESARQSRRRKKQYLELLEEKVSQLTDEIDNARRQHIDGAEASISQMKSNYVMALDQQASNSSQSPEEISRIEAGAKLLQQRFGPNNPERQAIMEYQFQQLNYLLLPPYTKFLLWLSIQDASFFSSDESSPKLSNDDKSGESKEVFVDHKDLWATLSNELGLSFEQEEALTKLYASSQSEAARVERRKIALAMSYLNRLRETVHERARAIQEHSDRLHAVLTPLQSVKYMAWLEKNQERIQTRALHEQYVSAAANQSSDADPVANILKKPDDEVTVEDVTELLAALT